MFIGMTLDGTYKPTSNPASAWAREQAEAYEKSGGAEANTFKDLPIVVMTSKGAKSGYLRKTPIMRVEHEGEYLAVASKGGAPAHPMWYHNLVTHPQVEIQDGSIRKAYSVRELSGGEREEWWTRAVNAYPLYAEYAEKTDRLIPLLLLTPEK